MKKDVDIIFYGLATGFATIGLLGFAITSSPFPGIILISIAAAITWITKRLN